MKSFKYKLKEGHIDISNMNLKQNCEGIGCYIWNRVMKKCDVNNIVCVKQQNVSPAIYAEFQCCQPKTFAVERSFSILSKLRRKDWQFVSENKSKFFVF